MTKASVTRKSKNLKNVTSFGTNIVNRSASGRELTVPSPLRTKRRLVPPGAHRSQNTNRVSPLEGSYKAVWERARPVQLPREVPMLFIGIDWADAHHDIFISNETGEKIDAFRVEHSPEGLNMLRDKIRILTESKDQILFAIETHKNLLVDFLLDEGFTVYSINPKAVDRYRDRYRVSGAKDDTFDSLVLANILRTDRNNYKPIMPNSVLARELKILTQDEQRLIQLKTKLLNQLQACLKDYYPSALTFFSQLDDLVTLEFFLKFSSPKQPSLSAISKFMKKHKCKSADMRSQEIFGKFASGYIRIEEFTIRAKSRMMITLAEQLISLLNKLDEYRAEINRLFEDHPDSDIFKSLPGAGDKTASRFLSEFGDNRERFSDKNEVQCYAGTAPVTRSSGNTCSVVFRHSCRKQLRNIVYQYAFSSIRTSPWANAYYRAQRAKGNSHPMALRALGNKWLKIIYHLWKNNVPYNEDRHLADIARAGYVTAATA